MGFAIATAYGDIVWGSFLIVWLVKVVVFRLAACAAIRRWCRGSSGWHWATTSRRAIVYGLVGSYGGEALRGYVVHFG